MTLTQWITLLAALGGPVGLGSLFFLLPQIRKLQADTAKVERDTDLADIEGAARLSDAALSQMTAAMDRATRAEAHTARVEEKLGEVTERLEDMEREMRAYREAAQDHVAWDVARIQDLTDMGHAVDPAPPLLPPPNRRPASRRRAT